MTIAVNRNLSNCEKARVCLRCSLCSKLSIYRFCQVYISFASTVTNMFFIILFETIHDREQVDKVKKNRWKKSSSSTFFFPRNHLKRRKKVFHRCSHVNIWNTLQCRVFIITFSFSLLQTKKAREAGASIYAIGIGMYVKKEVC